MRVPRRLDNHHCGEYRMFTFLPQAPVTSDVQYIFNVAMRDPNNITFAYKASNMSFFLTTYQQCVSDPECQSQVRLLTLLDVVGQSVRFSSKPKNSSRQNFPTGYEPQC